MDIESIENVYKEELKAAEDEFLDGIKSKKDKKELEKIYKDKLKDSRERYYKSVSGVLKKQKFSSSKKKPRGKNEKTKVFKVESGNFEVGFFQRSKFKLKLKWFKFKFRIRNSLRKKTPNSVLYNYIKIKIKVKKIFSKLSEVISDFAKAVRDKWEGILDKFKSSVKKAYKWLMELPLKIVDKFLKKKEKPKDASKEGDKGNVNEGKVGENVEQK